MSFELLPTLTPWLVGFTAVVVTGLATATAALAALATTASGTPPTGPARLSRPHPTKENPR